MSRCEFLGQASAAGGSPSRRGVRILGVEFDVLTRTEALARMEECFGTGKAMKVYIANAHTLNVASRDEAFRQVLNSGDLVLNDGTGVQIASWFAGKSFPDNLVGTDLTPQLLERAVQREVGVFLLGGEPGVPEEAARRLGRGLPGLRVCGTHHGFLEEMGERQVVSEINASGAGIVLVGFGNPLQEIWIHRNSFRLKCDLCIGVGGLIDHFAGRLRRAPAWMRRLGIEWVHILIRQPHKWRRYLLGNPAFVLRILKERIEKL